MYCMACGQELPDEAAFCWKCGKALAVNETVRPVTPAIVQLTCPNCAGKLSVSPDMTKLNCSSCSSELLIVRDDKSITVKLGRWEYREFVAEFGPNKFRKIEQYPSVESYPPVVLVPALERAVSQLIASVTKDGWEPVEATDIVTLWMTHRIKFTVKGDLDFGCDCTLVDLRVRCRRRQYS